MAGHWTGLRESTVLRAAARGVPPLFRGVARLGRRVARLGRRVAGLGRRVAGPGRRVAGPATPLLLVALGGCGNEATDPGPAGGRGRGLVREGGAAGSGVASPRTALDARSLVLVTLDTTRADRIGAWGDPKARTPEIDRLARRSIQFADCSTAAPTTLASHTSLFTGVHPRSHGVARNGFTVHEDNRLLAEILSEAGFHAAGFAGSFALDRRFGIADGFAEWDQEFGMLDLGGARDQDQRRADAVTDAVLASLDRRLRESVRGPGRTAPAGGIGANGKMFLFVHYFDPHLPYEPPSPFGEWAGDPKPDAPIDVAAVRTAASRRISGSASSSASDATRAGETRSEEARAQARRLEARYAGEVSFMDRELGRLLRGLDERRLLDGACVAVVADHGENFDEHEVPYDHGHTVFETTVRVPCLVAEFTAGVAPGTRTTRARGIVETAVSTVDLLPTLLERCGLEAPTGVEGRVLPLDGREPASVPVFAEATKPWEDVEIEGRWTNRYKAKCVREGDRKYVWTPWRSTERLFDLAEDPAERHDLLADRGSGAEERRALRDRLRERLEGFVDDASPLPSRFDPSQREETLERLRRLGYLDGGAPRDGIPGEAEPHDPEGGGADDGSRSPRSGPGAGGRR